MSLFSSLSAFFAARKLNKYRHLVLLVNELEDKVSKLTDEGLLARSKELQKELCSFDMDQELQTDDFLPEAFALVREAARRTLKQRHFDVQLIGGMVLHQGKVAEMLTGEGKTLVATLPTYFNALRGKGVHVVTVNDYLARRDTVWMGQVYHALGLTVSCLIHDGALQYDPSFDSAPIDEERDEVGGFKVIEKFLRPISRKEAYSCDITYGTNHEFGFDYLRDNLLLRVSDRVQREHAYAIIDEVDSILIDEARTPLIIASPDQESSQYYQLFARLVEQLNNEEDYAVDEKLRVVSATDAGFEKIERLLKITNIFDPQHSRLVHFFETSLKAKALFHKDKEYVVKNGEVIIVDEFTGRMLHGRRYSGGLHQAIEAKERVNVRQENRTYAQITIQNYFRMYKKIAGMTGTAQTSAEEFHKVYGLDVVSVPPNKPVMRKDMNDVVYKTEEAKYAAVAREVLERNKKGQPVLIGTASIKSNEIMSSYLQKAGIPHEVLNAKNNEREGAIIAQAGRERGVTVATNMAGRGVDIVFGGNPSIKKESDKVRELGGLHVIGTERHEARRIDNQLRGRSGRQGDPGSTQFFLSLEDDLLRIFGGDRIKGLMQKFNFPDDIPIESGIVSKVVNQAQSKVEGANFDIRKHLLDFDDVLNKQRTAMYLRREQYLVSGEKNKIRETLAEILERAYEARIVSVETMPKGEVKESEVLSEVEDEAKKKAEQELHAIRSKIDAIPDSFEAERAVVVSQHLVRILDMLWIDHLEHLESLRSSVNLRAYGQHEPLVEYRREAHQLFRRLLTYFEALTLQSVFSLLEIPLETLTKPGAQAYAKEVQTTQKKIGRNDPCFCGSKKKYKRCHGA